MENTDPLVSIIIPVYNGANYMRRAIDSALAQTYENIEIIVVNDGSTDEGKTEKIAFSYGEKIRYICKENGGVSSALNVGIRAMRGKYFSWLSHDDEYSPRKIQIQVRQLELYPEKKIIALCNSRKINKESKILLDVNRDSKLEPDFVVDWKDALYDYLKAGDYFGCALLIPKEALEQCGLFDESLRYSQDYLMWLKIFLSGYSLIYSDEVCAYKRRHSEQQANAIASLYYQENEKVADILMPDLIKASKESGNVLYWFACSRAKYNHYKIVKKCMDMGRCQGLFSTADCLRLYVFSIYGKIRPVVRSIYQKIYQLE